MFAKELQYDWSTNFVKYGDIREVCQIKNYLTING